MISRRTAKLALLGLFLSLDVAASAAQRAKNVILFLGDAGGLSTLNTASIYAHDKPQSLFIQNMPFIGLSDTSALDGWVTDSAPGMTAIVTGHKTNIFALSMLPGSNGAPGTPLKTILEYAEERGLSTGVVTNMPFWDATPAACFAHVEKRSKKEDIFEQFLKPRFGDGVDILIGADRKSLDDYYAKQNVSAKDVFKRAGYDLLDQPTDPDTGKKRSATLYDGGDFKPIPVIDKVLSTLKANRKGYFLMVEWDMHTDKLRKGLDRAIVMDDLIRHVSQTVGKDTLIIFAADHSFGTRTRGGKRDTPFAKQLQEDPINVESGKPGEIMTNSLVTVDPVHSGEEIVVAAQGPGAEKVHGFMPNTRIFEIMMSAYGWKPNKAN